jgi:hypothetical protein
MLRRAHQAMLDSRSSYLLTLASAALQGAIRNEGDLVALLPPEPSTNSRPQRRYDVSLTPKKPTWAEPLLLSASAKSGQKLDDQCGAIFVMPESILPIF